MTLLLLLGGGSGPAIQPGEGLTFEALDGLQLLFEVSESQPFAETQVWRDFSGYIHKASNIVVDRGRSSEFDDIRAGTLACTLDATNGDLDPNNGSSPVAGCLKPRRRCRLRAAYQGIVYPLFDGFTHGFPRSYRRPNIQSLVGFNASDGSRVLQNVDPTGGLFRFDDSTFGRFDVGRFAGSTASNQLSGSLVDALLDSVAWPSGLRDIAPGVVVVDGDLGSAVGLGAITAAAKAEGGVFYFDREGNAVFRERLADYEEARSVTLQATFSPDKVSPPSYNEPLEIAYDDTRIVNEASYTGASDLPQTYRDAESIDEWGINPDRDTLVSVNDLDALSLAVLKVSRYAWPSDRVEQIVVPAHIEPATTLPAVLGRELFDLVAVDIAPPNLPGSSVELLLQGLRLEISTATLNATLRLGPAPTEEFFRFDDSTLSQFDGVGVFAP